MKSLFVKSLNNTSKLKVLEFLIEGRELDYSISDIVEGAEIGRTTLFRIFDDLAKSGIVIPTRQIGNAKLFRLNTNSLFVKKMIELFDSIIIISKKKISA